MILSVMLLFAPVASALAQEGDLNATIEFKQDGPLSKELHLPLYEWQPAERLPITGLLLTIHGLTLHGKKYELVGKAFAADGFYACAPDMRGFGRCYADTKHEFSIGDDSKQKVDYEKSYEDLVRLATRIKQSHPGLPLYVMGESLGTCMCIKLAAEHPELTDGLILSGPTAKVNPLMFFLPQNFCAGAFALLIHPRFRMTTSVFVKHLVSNDSAIVQEMLDDPLCRKGLTIAELLKTDAFVGKTLAYAKKIGKDIPMLIIQGSEDRCMVPGAVTKLCRNSRSSDQTLRWLHDNGHLLLETAYISPGTVDAVSNWIELHDKKHIEQAKQIQQDVVQLGAKRPVGR